MGLDLSESQCGAASTGAVGAKSLEEFKRRRCAGRTEAILFRGLLLGM